MPALTRKKSNRVQLSTDVISHIADAVRVGVPVKYAAMQAGISESTIGDWLREADRGVDRNGKPLPEKRASLVSALANSIEEARGYFVTRNAANIVKHSKDDWRASSWMLSHSPDTKEEWSDSGRVRIEVERHLTVMTTVLQRELAPADYERVLFALAEAQSFQEVAA